MIYQKVACLGDSQTFGARTPIGYPELMATQLTVETKNTWACINLGVNEETTVQVLRRTDRELRRYSDVFIWTLMVGTNDCRSDVMTDTIQFVDLWYQLMMRMKIEKKIVIPALIPPIAVGYGHLPYTVESREKRNELNGTLLEMLGDTDEAKRIINWDGLLDERHYADAVHFNDAGIAVVAETFGAKILELAA